MPPLREIRADIPVLAMYFLRKQIREMDREVTGFSPDAMKALMAYSWPGNVRELENEVRRAVVLTSGTQIVQEDLSESVREEQLEGSTPDSESYGTSKDLKQKLKDRVTTLEIQMIRGAMTQTNGDKRRMAKLLGLSHQGLLNKLKRYGLQ
jgi:DNA-binding NtrC family response regulator